MRGLLVLLLSVAAVVLWLFLSQAPGPLEPAPPATGERLAAREEGAPLALDPAEELRAREPIASPQATSATPPLPPAVQGARDTLEVVVLDGRGGPVQGAHVRVSCREAEGASILDETYARRGELVGEGRTDALGRAAFSLAVGRPHEVAVEARSWPREHRRSCYAGERLEIRLQPGARLAGHLTRLEGGAPVAGARVRVAAADELRGERRLATSDAAGAWSFEQLLPGEYVLDVEPPREVAPRRIEVVLRPGDSQVLDVALRAGASVRGRVTDAATGAPIPGAAVGAQGRSVASDASGEYEFPGFGWVSLECRASGYASEGRRLRRSLEEPVPERVDFALRRGWTAAGRVVTETGQPVAEAYVGAAATDSGGELGEQRVDWVSDRTDAAGGFRLVSLRSDMLHTLVVRRPGHGTVLVDLAPAADGDLRTLPDVVLPRGRLVTGRVVDDRGAPLARHPVQLLGSAAGRERWLPEPRPDAWLLDSYVAAVHRRTDALGRFCFSDVGPGVYVVGTALGERHPEVRVPATVGDADVVDLVLEVIVGLSITGRVSVGDGGRVPKTYVAVQPEDGGTSAHAECDAEGRFEARGLVAGSYRLIFYPYPTEEEQAAGRRIASVRREGVRAGEDVAVVLPVEE